MNGCPRQETSLVKSSRSRLSQADILILRVLGHTVGSARFKVGREGSVVVAPWAALGRLRGEKKRQWKKITWADLKAVATHGGKIDFSNKLKLRVKTACRWLKDAQRQGVESVPRLHKLLKMQPDLSEPLPSIDLLRPRMVDRLKGMTLKTGLYVAPSTIAGAGKGLFTSVPIAKGVNVTFYDGVTFALDERQEETYADRRGWFIAVGHSSKNQGVIVGFTSADLPLPEDAGVVSLMNSSKEPNCRQGVIEEKQALLVLDGEPVSRVPVVIAGRDILPGEELTWDYEYARLRT